jgi:gamma-glutamyltranspeptidase/glutathione hydrolase
MNPDPSRAQARWFAPSVRACALAAAMLAAAAGGSGPVRAASAAPAMGEHGMVVTAQQLATRIGVDVLRQGGNAIDAAVAVGYALAVVYPAAGNLGGGGFMTIELAGGRRSFLDFREKAPLAATPDMYLDDQGQVIRGSSTTGYRAVAVPGTVSGLETARVRYGSMTRAALIAPAIRLAAQGFVLDAGDVRMLDAAADDFRKDPATAAIFLSHGQPYRAGERLVQADLARTLRRIRDQGARGFYQGPVGAAIVAASREGGGLITQADLDGYETRERPPVECDYRGYHVVSAPPPSSGGVVLCEMLNVLEGYPLKELGFRSAQAVHYQIEAMRHAYADRNAYLGDPDFVADPLDRLLDKAYAQRVRASIDPARAGTADQVRTDGLPHAAPHEGGNTTHYSIIDRAGNAVAVTVTLNGWFGARVTVPATGVLLNDEMDDFTSRVGVPNQYQLVQGAPNAIAPGKRPLSSMAPTIVSRDGQPVLVVGTPGGSRIPTTVLHVILNLVDYGMDVQAAVDAPRFHQQWLPEATRLEPFALSPDTQRILRGMGHELAEGSNANHVEAIVVGAPALGAAPAGANRYYGANDPRQGTGLALGF